MVTYSFILVLIFSSPPPHVSCLEILEESASESLVKSWVWFCLHGTYIQTTRLGYNFISLINDSLYVHTFTECLGL